jgi:hypothetical protein
MGGTFLRDVRQIGPDRERDISGACSACGNLLLARLDNGAEPAPGHLRAKLEKVFERHIAEKHPWAAHKPEKRQQPEGPQHTDPRRGARRR